MTEPVLNMTSIGDEDIATWEWNKDKRGNAPSMVFAHATGFHGRVFDALIEHFPGRHILSIEQHGHGRSTGGPVINWADTAREVQAVIEAFNITSAEGIGHSMGAHVLLQTAANNPALFSKLTLFDPVIFEPSWYEGGGPNFDNGEPHPTARRKRDFASPDAMFERFKDREPYSLFEPRVLRDYCDYGLLPADEGKVLACAPEVEASVYQSSRSNGAILNAARSVEIPVQVVRAKRTGAVDFTSSPTWPGLASIMPNGTDIDRSDMTHFHPFQDPADAARIIATG